MTPVRVRVFDLATLTQVEELDEYQSLSFERSWYGVGTFELRINANVPSIALAKAASLERGRLLVIGDDFSKLGYISEVSRAFTEEGKKSEIVTAKGRELKSALAWRTVIPPDGFARYEIEDAVETVLKTLVSDQCVAYADTSRNFPNFAIDTDAGRGATYLLSARYSTLAAEIEAACLATGFGWRLYLDGFANVIRFAVDPGVDRTSTQSTNPRAIFSSRFDTLRSATLTDSEIIYRNVVYAGGAGAGIARNIRKNYTGSDEPSGWSRREGFLDIREFTTDADIDTKAAAELAKASFTTFVEGQPLVYSPLVLGRDYDLGDIVTIESLGGTATDSRITSVKESWEPNRYEISLGFDRPYPELPNQLRSEVGSLRSTLNANET